jgi:hypothetical protein
MGNRMPRWRRGVLRAVDRGSGCDDEDVEGGTIDDDEAVRRSDGGGGGDTGGAGDDDGGPVRAAVEKLESDGGDDGRLRDEHPVHAVDVRVDDAADAPRVEEARARQQSSPIMNPHLLEPPKLSTCADLHYDVWGTCLRRG